jgi:D-alanyl-D-alanine carboxypeptidase
MTVHCSLKDQKTNHFLTVPDKVYSYNDHATSTGQSELWRINDLATYTLITSSNAGAVTLASNIGGEDAAVVCMNKEAGAMNLFETSFTNVTGLDIDDATAGAVGSAENVVTMLQKIYLDHEDIISKTAYDSYEIRAGNGTIHQALNTNIVAPNIVGFLASKTGLTDIAGGNITFVMDAGLDHKVFVAILGSTEADRFNDALALSDAIIKSFLK